ncbi:MAG: T9SS type A sorting domain-containing protein, partial [Chitinophagaceae bacterium]|nr:T9SS type A sorting domain-containing protein [Chitinophagaceae bacterium]
AIRDNASGIALPSNLSAFSAKLNSQTTILNWSTSQEVNTNNFEIEYSNDGRDFNKVAIVAAAGNSNTTKQYSYKHTINNNPVHYYRLKMVDKDGKFSYSEIVRLKSDNKGLLLDVYPTIVTNTANINITAIENSTASIEVYNTQGQKVQQQNIVLKPGTQSIKLDVSVLSKGNYFIRLVTNQQQLSTQIIKQ